MGGGAVAGWWSTCGGLSWHKYKTLRVRIARGS